jgi:hypothetical protein
MTDDRRPDGDRTDSEATSDSHGRQPGPTGTPIDDETDRTDLDMDEPFEGLGAGPWRAQDVSRDEALRALGGSSDDAGESEPSGEVGQGEDVG